MPTLVINDNYRRAPWADVLYACDESWWSLYINDVRQRFRGQLWTTYWDRNPGSNPAIDKYRLNAVHSVAYNGGNRCTKFVTRAWEIVQGSNSGLQGVNLVYHLGATAVLLLGYDMGFKNADKRHWFGNHPEGLGNDSNYEQYRKKFSQLNPPIPVINCSRSTFLECFPRMTLEAALAQFVDGPSG